jgi:hypothetical protein
MGSLLRPITGVFEKLNYVYRIELLVIISIVLVLLFIFNALGLLKKPK